MDASNGTKAGEYKQHALPLVILGASLVALLLLLLFVAVFSGLCKAIHLRRARKLNPGATTNQQKVSTVCSSDTNTATILQAELKRGLAPGFVANNANPSPSYSQSQKPNPSTRPAHFLPHNRPPRQSSAHTFMESIPRNQLNQRRRSPSLALTQQNVLPLHLSAVEANKRATEKLKNSPHQSEKSGGSSSVRPHSDSSSRAQVHHQKSLARDESVASGSSSKSSKIITSTHQLSHILNGEEDIEERRPSKTAVSEEQLMGLDLPHDQETEDREREMIKMILGPPRPVID